MKECAHPDCRRDLEDGAKVCVAHGGWWRRQRRKRQKQLENSTQTKVVLRGRPEDQLNYWRNVLTYRSQSSQESTKHRHSGLGENNDSA